MKALIKKLTEAWGPSGFEHHIRAIIEAEVKDLCDEMSVDNMGSLVCRVGKKTDTNLRVMIAAHMDEIGLMVSHIDREGYLRFSPLGGLFHNTLTGNRVRFENGVTGVVCVEDMWGKSRELPTHDGFYIDVSESYEDGKSKNADVKVGDAGAFYRPMEERGNRIIAKSMDDRIGCVVAIEAMRKLKETGCAHEVFFVFTVQEEVGVRGAEPAAYNVNPDLGFAVDICPTGDTPKGHQMGVKLGAGAAIKVKDARHIVPPAVKNLMIDTAERHGIPYQMEILAGGSTDASAIQIVRAGVPSGCISIPCRYAHTVSETVDINDVQACVDLLTAMLANPIENIKPR